MAQHFLLSAAARSLSAAKIRRMPDGGVANVFLRLRWFTTERQANLSRLRLHDQLRLSAALARRSCHTGCSRCSQVSSCRLAPASPRSSAGGRHGSTSAPSLEAAAATAGKAGQAGSSTSRRWPTRNAAMA